MKKNKFYLEYFKIYNLVDDKLIGKKNTSLIKGLGYFINPAIVLLVLWFIFTKFLNFDDVNNTRNFLILLTGLLPWIYLVNIILDSTSYRLRYTELFEKEKIDFKYIPLYITIKNFYKLFIYLFYLIVIYRIYQIVPSIYLVQIPIYLILIHIIGYYTSKIFINLSNLFKDIDFFSRLIIFVSFWCSNILWSRSSLSNVLYKKLLSLNPLNYIIEGFKNSFILNNWFFEKPRKMLYIFILIILMILFNAILNALNKKKKENN